MPLLCSKGCSSRTNDSAIDRTKSSFWARSPRRCCRLASCPPRTTTISRRRDGSSSTTIARDAALLLHPRGIDRAQPFFSLAYSRFLSCGDANPSIFPPCRASLCPRLSDPNFSPLSPTRMSEPGMGRELRRLLPDAFSTFVAAQVPKRPREKPEKLEYAKVGGPRQRSRSALLSLHRALHRTLHRMRHRSPDWSLRWKQAPS